LTQSAIELKPPRFAEHEPMVIAGLSQRFSLQTKTQIAALWQRFVPYLGHIPGQLGSTSYGICLNYQPDGSFEYLCGVQIAGSPPLPAELKTVEIPRANYAVFLHSGHISAIGVTWQAIFQQWLPVSGCTLEGEPNFEVYADDFDPRSGIGLVEIWVPLKAGTAA
jgi:AraC family transcriptional regulator